MSFLKHHFTKVLAACALLCVVVVPAHAQGQKIGFVNVPLLMDRAPQTKAAMDALEEEFAPRQRELLARQKEYQDLSEKVQRDVAVMGESERRNAEKDLRDLQREVVRLQNEYREDVNMRRNEELGNLQRALLKEVQDYSQSSGFDLVVGDGVLFASTAIDITEMVLRAVEANYQAANR